MNSPSRPYDVGMSQGAPDIDVQLLAHPVVYQPLIPQHIRGGGECVFIGRTRMDEHRDHGPLTRLSYEAYAPLAVETLQQLATRAIDLHGCTFVRIHHAIGEVPIGEGSVLVQVVCGHRGSAFDACRLIIDELKSSAPIWKREVWSDGSTWSAGVPVKVQP